MFKGLGNLGDLAGLIKEAGKMKERVEHMREELGARVIEGSAGGGMVVVKVNGRQEVLSVVIEDEALAAGDKEMLQDLVTAAMNAALDNAKIMVREELAKVTGGLNIDIPGIM